MVGARSGLWHCDKYQHSPSLSPTTFSLNEDSESAYYPAYGPNNTGYDEISYKLSLPGHGNKKTYCGTVKYATACSNEGCKCHHDLHLIREHCDSLHCPICYEIRIRKDAENIAKRIYGMGEAYRKERVHVPQIDHVQISIPEGLLTPTVLCTREGVNLAYRIASDILRRYVRLYGGVLILHPWRFKHLDGSTCPDKKDCKERHIPVFSPHFHYIGWGYWAKSNVVYAQTGIVYKKISPGQSRDVLATAYYLLTHCGILLSRQEVYDYSLKAPIAGTETYKQVGKTYRWYGMLSQSKGGFHELSRAWDIASCPTCASPVHEYDIDLNSEGNYYPICDKGDHLVLTIQGYYYISHRGRQSTILEKRDGRVKKRS